MSEDDNETESACNSSGYKQIEMQDFLALYVNEIAMVILNFFAWSASFAFWQLRLGGVRT